jgi:rhamnosyltransferase subunit B
MHAVLTPAGSSGDVNPFLMIGGALRRRGHDVTILAAEPFGGAAAAAGLRFVPVVSADEFDDMTRNPDLWHPIRGLRLVMRTMARYLRAGYAALDGVFEPGRTMLVGHPLAFPTRAFEETHGCPAATVHLAPGSLRSGALG